MPQNRATRAARSCLIRVGPAPGRPPATAQNATEQGDKRSEVLFDPRGPRAWQAPRSSCLLYTSDAADDM
eukprot:2955382-Alexandrium_andersonii.AAC.1